MVETQSTPVTRREVADAVGSAFGMAHVPRDAIVDAARSAGARSEVVRILEALPARSYNELRQLWADLPEMPVT